MSNPSPIILHCFSHGHKKNKIQENKIGQLSMTWFRLCTFSALQTWIINLETNRWSDFPWSWKIWLFWSHSFSGTNKPVNWRKPVFELEPDDRDNNGFINEDFIVWMRTAALPTFRKLYRIIHKKSSSTPTLASGRYILDITYSILLYSNQHSCKQRPSWVWNVLSYTRSRLVSLTLCHQITRYWVSTVASEWSWAPSPGWEGRTLSWVSPTSPWAPFAFSWAWFCSSSTTNMTRAIAAQISQTRSHLRSSPFRTAWQFLRKYTGHL